MRQRMGKKGVIVFLAAALILGGAWLGLEYSAPESEIRVASAQRMEQLSAEIGAQAEERTEQIMSELIPQLAEQKTPEYGPVYREIFREYEKTVVSAELGAGYLPPDTMYLESYTVLETGEPLFEEVEAAVDAQLAALTAHYTSVSGTRADQLRHILYPAIRAQIELEHGMSLSDPLEQAVEEALDREMNEVVRPQLALQGELDQSGLYRDVIHDQVRHRVYKEHGVDLNEFS